jgi:ribosomal protein S18 acetylase RimI-like enzyme
MERHMTAVTIREARPQDYHPLLQLFDAVDTLHSDNLPNIFQRFPGPARDKGYFYSLLSDEETALFIAEAAGGITGFILAFVRDTPSIPVFIPARIVLISDIAVMTKFRRQGIGSQLMERVCWWAKTKGATSIELNVYSFNHDAIDFYKAIGFNAISLHMRKSIGESSL